MSDNYEIWTTDEVMDYLLVGRNTLYNLLRKGKIKGFKIGSCWKIPKKAVDDYLASESGITPYWYRNKHKMVRYVLPIFHVWLYLKSSFTPYHCSDIIFLGVNCILLK